LVHRWISKEPNRRWQAASFGESPFFLPKESGCEDTVRKIESNIAKCPFRLSTLNQTLLKLPLGAWSEEKLTIRATVNGKILFEHVGAVVEKTRRLLITRPP
jgi:hypothetical protein